MPFASQVCPMLACATTLPLERSESEWLPKVERLVAVRASPVTPCKWNALLQPHVLTSARKTGVASPMVIDDEKPALCCASDRGDGHSRRKPWRISGGEPPTFVGLLAMIPEKHLTYPCLYYGGLLPLYRNTIAIAGTGLVLHTCSARPAVMRAK